MAGDDMLSDREGLQMSDLEVPGDGGLGDQIQTETAKISLLKAKILRIELAFPTVASRTVQEISRDLETWLGDLPGPMRLEALRNGTEMSDDHRRSVYYVHLLYQGARMLLYRRITSQHIQQELATRPYEEPVFNSPTMLQALEDGRRVADMTSHTLRILQDENGIFKRCWLVIFQTFTSCTLILFEAAQKQLCGMSEELWKFDLEMARAPLSTLEFCGTLDPVARNFYLSLISLLQ